MIHKHFTKEEVTKYNQSKQKESNQNTGDKRDGEDYVYDAKGDIITAINIAIETNRPLLLKGASGSGKSSLAFNIAKVKTWKFYEYVVNSKSQIGDLLYEIDLVARLADAQAKDGKLKELKEYIVAGVLWWAIDPDSIKKISGQDLKDPNRNPSPNLEDRAVILIDEIDKAEPDFANGLLIPFGSYQFTIKEINETVQKEKQKSPPLIIITTNEERDLPLAFVRRCIVFEIPSPDKQKLIDVGNQFLKSNYLDHKDFKESETLVNDLVQLFLDMKNKSKEQSKPDIAEFLDSLKVCIELKEKGADLKKFFDEISSFTMNKHEKV